MTFTEILACVMTTFCTTLLAFYFICRYEGAIKWLEGLQDSVANDINVTVVPLLNEIRGTLVALRGSNNDGQAEGTSDDFAANVSAEDAILIDRQGTAARRRRNL